MKFYKIDDQIVISDKSLSVGAELTPNTRHLYKWSVMGN